MSEKIDVVITWVDNNDLEWQKQYNKYNKLIKKENYDQNSSNRYEDLGTLKYIFRGIEKFMPWVNAIHLVTAGHYPKWLNTLHPKVKLVNHKDIFENLDDLPTFNSPAIELNFHRIPDLTEKFIYFNDDMFILNNVLPEFFFSNGLPKAAYLLSSKPTKGTFKIRLKYLMNLVSFKEKYFKQFFYCLNIKSPFLSIKNIYKLIVHKSSSCFRIDHQAVAHLKSNFENFQKKYPQATKKTIATKFRESHSISQYGILYEMLVNGRFKHKTTNGSKCISFSTISKLKKKELLI